MASQGAEDCDPLRLPHGMESNLGRGALAALDLSTLMLSGISRSCNGEDGTAQIDPDSGISHDALPTN